MANKNAQLEETLQALLRVADTKATIEEFTKTFGEIIDVFLEMKRSSEAELAAIKPALDSVLSELKGTNAEDFTHLKTVVMAEVSRALKEQADGLNFMRDTLRRVQSGKDGRDGIDGTNGVDGTNGKDGSPDTPEQVRDKLASLEGDERLDKSAIKGLDEALSKLSRGQGGTNFVIARGAVKAYDLSSQLNGVLTTFSMPSFWRVISIHLSSFPGILRENVDYTTDGTLMKLTFTSEIDAATVLSTGQTCIVVYAEP